MTSAPDDRPTRSAPLDSRRIVLLLAGLTLLIGLSIWRARSASIATVHAFAGLTMGTTYSVKVNADLDAHQRAEVRRVIDAQLDRVNELMSTYDSSSELSRFNRSRSTEPMTVSEELLEVLGMASEVSEKSGGAFDVTVAPLVDAWGFGPSEQPPRVPDPERLDSLMLLVGHRRVVVDRALGTVSKTEPLTVVDLSAIAKGYGVERVAEALTRLGLTRFLVEVGGELKAGEARLDGRAWRVGIEKPDPESPGVYASLDLAGEAIATSGDYRNYFEENGVRYAHIIDPRTGYPIRSRGAAVSVVHENAAMADAWATALSVLGPEKGNELAGREGIAALFVMQSDGTVRSLETPGFASRGATVLEHGR